MKAKSPLFETITKTIKPSPFQDPITFRKRYGRDIIIKKHPFPTDAQSPAQMSIRTAYARLVSIWNTPGIVHRAVYIPDAEKYNITTYNAFLQRNLPVMIQKPVLYMPADAGTGTTLHDYSVHANDGTIHGATWETLPTGNHVLNFDGVDDYVEVPYSATLNPSVFTVEAWAKVTGGAGTWRSLITSRIIPPRQGYIIYAGNNDFWQFWVGEDVRWRSVTGPPIQLNQWIHIAATYDGTRMRFYANGALIDSSVTTFLENPSQPLRIGAGATEREPRFFFHGHIDEIRIYNRPLSHKKIRKNFKHSRVLFS